jgi:hypothetical protein
LEAGAVGESNGWRVVGLDARLDPVGVEIVEAMVQQRRAPLRA